MQKPALYVTQLTVNYDSTAVLWDIHFSVPKGAMVGILGPNGAGKSTLLKSILQMIDPLSGHVEFFGMPLKRARKKIAYVPQRSAVDWDFPITALEVVMMGLYAQKGLFSFCGKNEKHLAEKALAMVGMQAFALRQISELSGGQQQRVFIARALVQDADMYFMDEPFAGVDMTTEDAIVELLKNLQAQGKTLFVVHHDLNTAKQYFDMAILLNTSLIACGDVDDVLTEKNVTLAYGQKGAMLGQAIGLARRKNAGL